MSEENAEPFASWKDTNVERVANVIEKLVAAAQPGAVFGQPVVSGDYTVITASEVATGGGFGFGGGGGPASGQGGAQTVMASGSGGGGGGGSSGRPVAIVVIGPDGVTVKPVLDFTKLAIAGITAWGAIAIALSKMSRAAHSRCRCEAREH